MFKTLMRLAINNNDPDKALEIMAPLTVGPNLHDDLTELEFLANQLRCWVMIGAVEKSKEFASRLITLPEKLFECPGGLIRPQFLEPLHSFIQLIKTEEPTFDTSSIENFIKTHLTMDSFVPKTYDAPEQPIVEKLDWLHQEETPLPMSETPLDASVVGRTVHQGHLDLCEAVTLRDLCLAEKLAKQFIQEPLRDDTSLMAVVNYIDLMGNIKGYFHSELDEFKAFIKAHASSDPIGFLVHRINDAMMIAQADFLSETPKLQSLPLLSECLKDAKNLVGHDDLIKALEDTIEYVKQLINRGKV